MQSLVRQVGRVVGKQAARGTSHHGTHRHNQNSHYHQQEVLPNSQAVGYQGLGGIGADEAADDFEYSAFSDAEIEAVKHDLFDQETSWLADSPALAALASAEEKRDNGNDFLVNEASMTLGVRLAKLPEFQHQVLSSPACADALGFEIHQQIEPGRGAGSSHHESSSSSSLSQSSPSHSHSHQLSSSSSSSSRPYHHHHQQHIVAEEESADAFDGLFDSSFAVPSGLPAPSRDVFAGRPRRRQDGGSGRQPSTLTLRAPSSRQAAARDAHSSRGGGAGASRHHANTHRLHSRAPPQHPSERRRMFSSLASAAYFDDVLDHSPFPDVLQPGANGRKLASCDDGAHGGEWGVSDTISRLFSWVYSFFTAGGAHGTDVANGTGEIPREELARVLREQPEGAEPGNKSRRSATADRVSSAIAIATVIVIAVFLKRQLTS